MFEQRWVPETRNQLDQDKLRIINAVLNKIPQLSLSVKKIIEMVGDKEVDSKELVEVASADPVLASKILMMVNSSYYGLNRKIDNLRLAIVLLGFNEVRNIAIQSGFLKAVGDLQSKRFYDLKKLWTHSYLVSVCAEGFAGEEDPKKAGTFMTMGILHDIGKFALQVIGDMMDKKGITQTSAKEFSSDMTTLANEQKVFGVTHTVIGSLLGERWNLSERVCTVIEYHHHPSFFNQEEIPPEFLEDISAVCIADLVVNTVMGESTLYETPAQPYFDAIGYFPPLGAIITDELRVKLTRAQEYAVILA